MAKIDETRNFVNGDRIAAVFAELYGGRPEVVERQRTRYLGLLDEFARTFPGSDDVELFSTPGRTEVGGNHTDHNGGRVLAAAVDLDSLAAVSKNDEGVIRIMTEGFPNILVCVHELVPVESEKLSSAALVRGVCAKFAQLGYRVGGFSAVVKSNVPNGAGLSSSASFEVLIATILNHLYNNAAIDDVLIAQIAQYSENNYFGKPCGLMDQTTCSVGGLVTIDFRDFQNPVVEKVDFDFDSCGYTMVVSDTGGSHADLNGDYTALEHEMKSVARALGGQVLRDFTLGDVMKNIPYIRGRLHNDRALLRAVHFYGDDQRVVDQVRALRGGDFNRFLELVTQSGESSWMLCQNCYSSKGTDEQGVSVALAVSESLLKGRGAWRVHGGGFAGTIESFVPEDMLDEYICRMEGIFGKGSCHRLVVRPSHSTKLIL
ncbi:MAG: galactokinase family protein [Clostridia bacterium]|nr:galactokinase family protein [Clostridia bacterium]